MDNKRLEAKIDKMVEDISEIKITMAQNTASLETHIRRTEIAEEQISTIKDDIKPIKSHVAFVKGAIWSLGIVGAVILGLHELGIIDKLFGV